MWPRCCWSPLEYSLGVMPSQLARVAEAREVTDLCDQAERGQRLDATERAQPLDLPGPALVGGDLRELCVEREEDGRAPVALKEVQVRPPDTGYSPEK
jgi:hypothetical protein